MGERQIIREYQATPQALLHWLATGPLPYQCVGASIHHVESWPLCH